MKKIINELKEYISLLTLYFKDGKNNNSKTQKWSQAKFSSHLNFLSIIVNSIIFFILTPQYIRELVQTPNLINTLVLIAGTAISTGVTFILKYEMTKNWWEASCYERDYLIEEIKNNKIKLNPLIKNTILCVKEKIQKEDKIHYTMEDILTIVKENSNITLSPDFFKDLYTLLKESKKFTEEELVEVFGIYFSYNYKSFHNHLKSKKNKLENYNNHYGKLQEAKQYIDELGNIIPNKISYDENFYTVITCDNYFELPNELIANFIKYSNDKLEQKETYQETKRMLSTLIRKMTSREYKLNIAEHDKLQSLMKKLNYTEDKIKKINKAIELKQLTNLNYKKAEQKELDTAKKEGAINLLMKFLDSEKDFQPLKFISEDELALIGTSLQHLNSLGYYSNEKVKYILEKIHKTNSYLLKEAEKHNFNNKRHEIFIQIDNLENKTLGVSAIEIYNNATLILKDKNLDISLKFFKDKIQSLIEFINEYINTLITSSYNLNDIKQIEEALIEIDNVFEIIYTISPETKRRIQQKKESI